MDSPGPRTVLFDVGGTLIDIDADLVAELLDAPGSGPRLKSAEGALRREVNEFLGRPQSHTEAPDTLAHILASWCRLAGLTPSPESFARVAAENRRRSIWRSPNPDALGIPDSLRARGHRVAVVSNSDGRVAELLDSCGYEGRFETVIDSGRVGVAKPDPAIFRFALDALDENAGNCLYIGDIPAVDVASASKAGIFPVLYDPRGVYREMAVELSRTLGGRFARIETMKDLPALAARI